MFLIQKYNVNSIDDIVFNKRVYEQFINNINIQNLIIYGQSSSGKKTFVKFLLKQLYGSSVLNTKDSEYTITNYGSNNVKVKLQQSNFHIVFKPYNSALDKYIIQEILLEFCKKNNLYFFETKVKYKIILIYNAELLSTHAQYALRSLMEQYTDVCRFILIVKNINTILDSIISRSNKITLVAPTTNEIEMIINKIIHNENITITQKNKEEIITNCNRNIKNMYWQLESYNNNIPYECYWKIIVEEIFNCLLQDTTKSLKKLSKIRDNIGLFFISNIDAGMILEYLLILTVKKINNINLLSSIIKEIAIYEKRLKNSTRYILHFEGLFNQISYLIVSNKESK